MKTILTLIIIIFLSSCNEKKYACTCTSPSDIGSGNVQTTTVIYDAHTEARKTCNKKAGGSLSMTSCKLQ